MKVLLQALEQKGMTRNKLALQAQINPADLYSAMSGKREFYPQWRKRVAAVLEVQENELFPEVNEHGKVSNNAE